MILKTTFMNTQKKNYDYFYQRHMLPDIHYQNTNLIIYSPYPDERSEILNYLNSQIYSIYSIIHKNAEINSSSFVYENSYLKKKSRRNNSNVIEIDDEENLNENLSSAYGNLTSGIFTNMLLFLSNITSCIEFRKLERKFNLKNIDEYNITQKSVFLDLGSGYGQPCFHTHYLVGCKVIGVELMEGRVKYSEAFKYSHYSQFINMDTLFDDMKKDYKYVEDCFVIKNINFEETFKGYNDLLSDCHKLQYCFKKNINISSLIFEQSDIFANDYFNFANNNYFSHIFMYGVCFFGPHNITKNAKRLSEICNNSNFKVIILNLDQERIQKYNFKNLHLIKNFVGKSGGGGQSFTFYIYVKI